MDDHHDFEEWYRRTRPGLVRSLVVASAGDIDAAADAADEAFVRAFERWKRVARMDSPAAWTYRTGLNVLRRRFRRRTTETTALRALWISSGAPTVRHDSTTSQMELWNVVSGLGERERTVLALRYLGELSEAEVADAMGLSVGGASSLLSRARGNLRRALCDKGVPIV